MAGAGETVTKDEARAAFIEAGVTISDDQLERWRGLGLLPPARQRGLGKGRGSTVDFDFHEVAQAIDIARLFQVRRKVAWVGWRLWIQGYEVHDRYWRPSIQQARDTLIAAQKTAVSIEGSTDAETADFIRRLPTLLAGTPFAAPLVRMDESIAETMASFFREIVSGKFEGLSHDDDGKERNALIAIAGSVRADQDNANGRKLNLNNQLESTLRDLSAGIAITIDRDHRHAPSASLRREFLTVITLARDVISIFSKGRGMSAFGLGTLNRILRDMNIVTEATMLLFWVGIRLTGSGMLTPTDVIGLAELCRANLKGIDDYGPD